LGEADLRSVLAPGSTGVMAAAVAAVGLAALAGAHDVSPAGDLASHPHLQVLPLQDHVAGGEPAQAEVALQLGSVGSEALQPSGHAAATAGSSEHAQADHSLTGSESRVAADPGALPQDSEGPAIKDATFAAVAPAMVSMPSAEALEAAFQGLDDGSAASARVALALGEALSGSDQAARIDALLEAAAPLAGKASGEWLQHGGDSVGAGLSSWDGAGVHSFPAGHDMLAALMTAHPDMQQPA
jgi:hypothetical protein